jgi:hypothetical protein
MLTPRLRGQFSLSTLTTFVLFSSLLLTEEVIADSTFSYDVTSTRGWQPTLLKVTAGQLLTFSAVGSWSVDYRNLSYVGPDGYDPEKDSQIYQGCKLDSSLPYGKLLFRVGDDSTFTAIGNTFEFIPQHNGFLEFRIHDADACLIDNKGMVTVTVTGAELASSTPLPFYYCITSQVPTDSSPGICQSAYATPLPNWQQAPQPDLIKWLNSPSALECLSSISFLSELSIKFAPGLRKLLERSPELIKKIVGETKPAANWLDILTLSKSLFEKFYDKVTKAGIPVAPIREEDDKRILQLLFEAAAETVLNEVTAQSCRDALGVPVITTVEFPSSIVGDHHDEPGTVYFTDNNAGVNWAQFDVESDTCGGCMQPFGFDPNDFNTGVSDLTEGQFDFHMWCETDTGHTWTTKITLRDKDDNMSDPYTLSVQCKPVSGGM